MDQRPALLLGVFLNMHFQFAGNVEDEFLVMREWDLENLQQALHALVVTDCQKRPAKENSIEARQNADDVRRMPIQKLLLDATPRKGCSYHAKNCR